MCNCNEFKQPLARMCWCALPTMQPDACKYCTNNPHVSYSYEFTTTGMITYASPEKEERFDPPV